MKTAVIFLHLAALVVCTMSMIIALSGANLVESALCSITSLLVLIIAQLAGLDERWRE